MRMMSAIPRIVGDLQRTVQDLRSENSALKVTVARLVIENADLKRAAGIRSEAPPCAQGSGLLKRPVSILFFTVCRDLFGEKSG